jgi:hypothetical protein
MSGLIKTLAVLAACSMCGAAVSSAARAADGAPVGAWRTTNGCFLAAFLLTDDGRAQTAYRTGEQDEKAAWSWDGSTLKITSMTFDLDSFTAHLTNDQIEADYVWHDLDRDQLNHQSCVFERFTPGI